MVTSILSFILFCCVRQFSKISGVLAAAQLDMQDTCGGCNGNIRILVFSFAILAPATVWLHSWLVVYVSTLLSVVEVVSTKSTCAGFRLGHCAKSITVVVNVDAKRFYCWFGCGVPMDRRTLGSSATLACIHAANVVAIF